MAVCGVVYIDSYLISQKKVYTEDLMVIIKRSNGGIETAGGTLTSHLPYRKLYYM